MSPGCRHEVMGVFMRNWDEAEEQGNQNCSLEADYRDADKVCRYLGIPLHTADFVSAYWTRVFTPFLAQVRLGTPRAALGRKAKMLHRGEEKNKERWFEKSGEKGSETDLQKWKGREMK